MGRDNPVSRYALPAIALHWLHAGLIAGLLALGWYMVDLPKGAERSWSIGLHKSLGLCALALVLLRFAWRRRHSPPPLPLPEKERRMALAGHRLLYVLLFLVPVAGYLSASFTTYPMKFFGLLLPRAGWPDAALNGLFNGLHKTAAWMLLLTIALHVAAALRHALKKDGVVWRMLPVALRDDCSISEQSSP